MGEGYELLEWDGDDDDDVVPAATTWTTQDGRSLHIKDMDDKHLENTINWLERRGYLALIELGKGAMDPVTLAEAKMCGTHPLTAERYKNMLGERERRKKNAPQPATDDANSSAR